MNMGLAHPAKLESIRHRAGPAGQIVGIHSLGEPEGVLQGRVEILIHVLALHAATQKIGPEEFAERGGVLGVTAGAAQLSGEAAERIVDEPRHRFRNIAIVSATPVLVERVHPASIVEHHPESVSFELAEVGDHRDQHILHALLVKRAGEMVMIDDVVTLLGPEDYRNHVLAEKGAFLAAFHLAPMVTLGADLAHADSDLRGPKFRDRDGDEHRITRVRHDDLLICSRP